MFRLISIVLALALAGMGEASLMMQDNSAENWAEAGVEAQNNASNTEENKANISGEVDFNTHFVQPTVSLADAEGQQDEEGSGETMMHKGLEDRGSSELIHLMINGQIDHAVQMH